MRWFAMHVYLWRYLSREAGEGRRRNVEKIFHLNLHFRDVTRSVTPDWFFVAHENDV